MKYSKKFERIFKKMYESEKGSFSTNITYSDIMKTNSSRINFLNTLLDMACEEKISYECNELLKENIDFIYNYMKGDYNTELSVPEKYFEDKEDCTIIPSNEELDYLFSLIKMNLDIFNEIYKDRDMLLILPNNSFNMNMARILEVKSKNLAHLMGLTESDKKENDNSNLLKKYFLENVDNQNQYGDTIAEQLLNWIISDEGKKEIKRLNKITLDFLEEDKKKNPTAYDKQGNIKNLNNFKKRFKERTSLEYPIIKFSRYITKCINNINYMNLSNINQMILDYNAPIDPKSNKPVENDEKDIFLVNTSLRKLLKNTKEYIEIFNEINKKLREYAKNPNKKNYTVEEYLAKEGINIEDKNIKSYINLITAYNFVEKNGIKPNQDIAINKINNAISKHFERDIHLIGFGTNFEKDEFKNIKLTKIGEAKVDYSHCDTSISIKIPELISKYYKRGRAFFIDKVFDTKGDILKISNPTEEIEYQELFLLLGIDKTKELNELNNKMKLFEEKYYTYKMIKSNGRSR